MIQTINHLDIILESYGPAKLTNKNKGKWELIESVVLAFPSCQFT